MARTPEYLMEDIKRVEKLINGGYDRHIAIRMAGYSDPSVFYKQLKRNRIREMVFFKKVPRYNFM